MDIGIQLMLNFDGARKVNYFGETLSRNELENGVTAGKGKIQDC